MIKITYTNAIFSLQKYGGISRYFCEVASRLSLNNSCKVKIIGGLYKNEYLRNIDSEIVFGMKMPSILDKFSTNYKLNQIICNLLTRSNSTDILHHTYYLDRKDHFQNTGSRVLTVFDLIHEKFHGVYPGLNTNVISKKRESIRASDHIICISENTKKDLLHFYPEVNEEQVSVIYLGSNLQRELDTLNFKQHFNAVEPYFLYVGSRLPGYKNFDVIWKAFTSSNRIYRTHKIICFGTQKLKRIEIKSEELRKALEENKIIYMHGDDFLLKDLYSHAEALIYPSIYEGFGIPPLEAMVHRCPVICSNASSLPEVVGKAGLLFEPSSVEQLMTLMENIVESKNLRDQLITSGLERSSLFSWERTAKEHLDLYMRLQRNRH